MIAPAALRAEAHILMAGAESEARFRTVIGRAYYATYHQVLPKVRGGGTELSGDGSDHGAVQSFFRNHPDRRMRAIGDMLRRMRRRRNLADYDLTVRIGRGDAEDAVLDADDIVERLEVLNG